MGRRRARPGARRRRPDGRSAGWERRAGIVAGYRELRGHTDHTDALGRPPAAARQAEAYAAYRAAWHALGRPEVEQAEHEMSNGAHRACGSAPGSANRPGAPRYVGNELAGTRQAADPPPPNRRPCAAPKPSTPTTPTSRPGSSGKPRDASALADTLDQRVTDLEELDAAHLGGGCTPPHPNGEGRDLPPDPRRPRPRRRARRSPPTSGSPPTPTPSTDDERHRPVTEDDVLDDELDDRLDMGPDRGGVDDSRATAPANAADEVVAPDIRDTAAVEPGRARREDEVRVTTADESADGIESAKRAIREIEAREAWERQAEQDEHDAQLARWHDDDRTDSNDADRGDADIDEPVLDRAPAGYSLDAAP